MLFWNWWTNTMRTKQNCPPGQCLCAHLSYLSLYFAACFCPIRTGRWRPGAWQPWQMAVCVFAFVFSRSFLPPRSLKHARSIRRHCVIAVTYMTRAFALNCKLQMAADCLASPAMLIFQMLKEVCAYQFYPWQKPGQAIVISPLDNRRL